MTSDVRQSDLVNRAKAILTSPKTEWPVIASEPATIPDLYTRYVMILAAIPAVAGFLKMSILGISVPLAGTIRVSVGSGLTSAIMTYVLSLVGIFILALIIDALAPTFGGTKNQIQALKVAAYSYTAFWVASAAQILPLIGFLVMFAGGIYSLYLLYLGLPVTMQAPQERALPYTAVVVLCAFVIGIVMSVVLGVGGASLVGSSVIGGGPFGVGAVSSISNSGDASVDPNSFLGKLEGYANRIDSANKNFETAQKSGDAQAQQDALGALLGTALGGNGKVESLSVDQIRAAVPETLGGLPRKDISAERNAIFGIQLSQAEASYSDGNKSLKLEITDLGGTAGLMALASWANLEQEKQTSTGFERTYKQGGAVMHEVWNNASKDGEFAIIGANRFMVKVTGKADSMDQLKRAASGVDLARLEQTKAAGK